MEYPRLQCAIECQVNSTLVVPLFISNSVSEEIPFAVMEIVMDRQTMLPGTLFETVAAAIRSHGFYTCDTSSLGSPATMRKVVADTVDSLCESNSQALAHMCRSLGMLLAQCWLPDSTGEWLIASGAPFCMGDVMTLPYRQLSEQVMLRRGQGPVGRAMEKGGIVWVDDVQNGSQVEWPLHHATALLGLHGMCACRVLVQKKDGEKTEAVLELYFPGNLKTPEQQQPCVDAVWNHLHGSSTLSMLGSAGDSENPGAGVQPIPTDISNVDPSFGGSLSDVNAPKYDYGVAGGAGDAKPPWGITLEMLQKHFSKHLKEAAKDLGVGSTTLKRICRHFGISRWPRRSLKSKQGRLQNALKTLSAEGALPPGQFGIHASGTYMGQPGTSAFNDGLDTDSPGGSMHDGSSFGGSMHGGSSYGGSMHAALNFPPVAQSFGGSAHAGAAFGGGGAMGGAMGGAAGGSTRAGSNTGVSSATAAAWRLGTAAAEGPGRVVARWRRRTSDDGPRSPARVGARRGGGGLNIPSVNPLRGNSFHGANGGHFGASPTGLPGMMHARNGSFGGGGASFGGQSSSPGRGAGGSGDFGGMWSSFESAGTSLGLEEGGGGGGRAHGGSAAGSLLRQSKACKRARAGRWRTISSPQRQRRGAQPRGAHGEG